MKCELCHQNDAETVFFRDTEEGRPEELYVCGACAARERAFSQQHGISVTAMDAPPFDEMPMPDLKNMPKVPDEILKSMHDFFGLPNGLPNAVGAPDDEPICKTCGTTCSDFLVEHCVGCPDCYTAFKDLINDHRIFTEHTPYSGKKPNWYDQTAKLNDLKKRFAKALEDECFDLAARLDLDIKALERDLPKDDDSTEEDNV